ncbi:hypothetical protein BJ741DRAFT_617498 [Chytriomyces cf. hyalinus JEL632]|nr:hypothetical protein BJ741DRAFT_617498 [Chytriomyces cf. hyalinus JEL632]
MSSNSASAATSAAAASMATSSLVSSAVAFAIAGFPLPYPYPTQTPPDNLLWPPFYPYPPPPPSPGLPWRQAPPNGVFPAESPIPPSWPMGFPWPPPLKNDPRILPPPRPPPGVGLPGAGSPLNPTVPFAYPFTLPPSGWIAPIPTSTSTSSPSGVSNGTSSSSPFDDSTIPSNITLICSLATAVLVFGFIMCIGWWIRRRYFAVRDRFGRPTATKLMPVADDPTGLEQSNANTGLVWNDQQHQFQTRSERSVGWSEVPTLAGQQPVGGGPEAEQQQYQRALISHNLDQGAFVPGGVHSNASSRMLGYAPSRGVESGTFLIAQEKGSPISWISPHPQQQYHFHQQQQQHQQHQRELVMRGSNSIELDPFPAAVTSASYPRDAASPFASQLQPQKYKLPDVA